MPKLERQKLSKSYINALDPAKNAYFVWDALVLGFGCRIYPAGRKSYIVQYLRDNTRYRKTIGDCSIMPLEEARDIASTILLSLAHGANPFEDEQVREDSPTMEEFAEIYINAHAIPKKKPSSVKSDKSLLKMHILPKLGKKKIVDIGRKEVQRIHREMASTPGAANRVIALLSKMFNLAEKWDERADGTNPCRHVEKYPGQKLGRYITPEELYRLGQVLELFEREADEMRWNDGAARVRMVQVIRLLILTGCRVSEITSLKWDYIDFDLSLAFLPDSKTGAKVVYFNEAAIDIIKTVVPLNGSPYLFPGRNGEGHITRMGHLWVHIREKAGLEDLRMHDLRHGFASVGVGMGESLHMVGQLLGHTQAQTTSRYAHLATSPLLDATNRIGKKIAEGLSGNHKSLRPNSSPTLNHSDEVFTPIQISYISSGTTGWS